MRNKNNKELNDSEIGDLRTLTFMKSDRTHEELLIESVKLTNEAKMDERERVYTKALQSFLANKFIQDEEKYNEVMKMIEMGYEEFSFGPIRRLERNIRKKVIEEVKKEEQEKNEKKIKEMEKEMKKRGMDINDIQAIIQIAK